MTILASILILFHTLGAIATIMMIGKPREPITRPVAYGVALIDIALIIAVAVLGSAAAS